MSLERVLKLLETFGLARADAEVYIYLAKKGPKSEQDLATSLKMKENQLCISLKSLQSRGIVTATIEQSALFSAVAFEKILELIVKANIEQAVAIKKTKQELLAGWRSNITREDT